ncbi:MAG TPA: acyl-CoA dehydrogenase family protein [Pseudonocardia sp.]|jgi:alkylation response protein AidB-like acyl-CoA dehydrogenase
MTDALLPAPFAHPGLTEERGELGLLAGEVFAGDPDADRAGAELGWFGIGIPERLGGSDGTLADLAPIVEAAGAAGSASALGWSTGLLAPLLLAQGGPDGDSAAGALLGEIAAGRCTVALPVTDPWHAADSAHSASSPGAGLIVHGAAEPTVLLLPVLEDGEPVLEVVEAGGLKPVVGIDVSRRLHRVVPGERAVRLRIRGAGLFERLSAGVGLIAALDSVGAAGQALHRTISYAGTREQFGRPLGQFQAYKHRCASAFIRFRLAQSTAYRAVAESPDPTLARSAALVGTSDCTWICGETVQLHGAIGFSWETGLHVLLKRARANQLLATADQGRLVDALVS